MKTNLIALCLLSSSVAVALPASVMCPSTVTCDYAAGKCKLPSDDWAVFGAYRWDAPEGEQVFKLTEIYGYESSIDTDGVQNYIYQCSYSFEPMSPETDSVVNLVTTVKKFTGNNWGYHGFGKRNPLCNDITPERCTAEK